MWCRTLQGLGISFCFDVLAKVDTVLGFSSKVAGEQKGQASVEAAVMMPVFMLLMALLLQPAFLLYTRSIMQQAASEGVRVLMTAQTSGDVADEACRAYVLRRLGAVPNIAAFHTGGKDGWTIELSGDASSSEVGVSVEGKLRPLPLIGILASMLGEVEGDEVLIKVSVTQTSRPSWLEGSYDSWAGEWG